MVSFQKQPRWRWSRWSWRERWSSTQCSTSSPSSSPSWCLSPCSSMSCQSQSVCSLFRFGAPLIVYPSRKLFQGNPDTNNHPDWLSTGDIFKRKALLLLWFPWRLSCGRIPSPRCCSRSPRTHLLPGLLSLSPFDDQFHFCAQHWKWGAQ